tara:strand:- start:25 stop:579 length:555 start_codon:yes stop_codon:yes gene_type:complete
MIGKINYINQTDKKYNIKNTKRIRLIDVDGTNLGIVPIRYALLHAEKRGIDLIMMNSKAQPHVCKFGNHSKLVFEKKKRKRQKSCKQRKMGIYANISFHDLETKIKRIKKFLKQGDNVRIAIHLKHPTKIVRSFIMPTKLGEKILNQVLNNCQINTQSMRKVESNNRYVFSEIILYPCHASALI